MFLHRHYEREERDREKRTIATLHLHEELNNTEYGWFYYDYAEILLSQWTLYFIDSYFRKLLMTSTSCERTDQVKGTQRARTK